jgi:hypothetical protein
MVICAIGCGAEPSGPSDPLVAGTLVQATTVADLPPGDLCSTATPITIGSTIFDTTENSSADHYADCVEGPSGNEGRDMAFTFESDGGPYAYTANMQGGQRPGGNGELYDTVVHVHLASACAASDQIDWACNDDWDGVNHSIVTFTPPVGSVYLVADGYDGNSYGPFNLVTYKATIDHDTCASPIWIGANGTYTGTTSSGQRNDYSPQSPTCPPNSAPDVVYVITARHTGPITATTAGSSYDTMLYVSQTCGGMPLQCNDDAKGSLTSSITWDAVIGENYYIVVDGYSTDAGSYKLNISGY